MVRPENAGIAKAAAGQKAQKGTKKVSGATGEVATGKATKTVAVKTVAAKASNGTSKAELVRKAFTKDPNAKPSEVAKATGVDPAYVWDIRKAMQAKAEKADAEANASAAKAEKNLAKAAKA